MSKTHAENVAAAAEMIRTKIGARQPRVAVILGSGLGGLGHHIKDAVTISYKDLPGFPDLTVEGHAGEVVAGKINGADMIALKGRKHFYETNDAYPLKTVIRTMKTLGVETLFISNAAGSLNPDIKVGDLMAIADHINLMGFNPLVGDNDVEFGPRFPPLTDAWDETLTRKMSETAKKLGMTLREGVYVAFRGPSFETPAEIRMARAMGGDAVGMSSVPDCIIARHCGLKVVGCSCITNMGAGLSAENLSHAHTLENAKKAAAQFENLLMELLPQL